MLFSASSDHVKVMRDGRVEDFSFMQWEDIDGEVVEECIGDEEVNRITFLLGCDQLFIPHGGLVLVVEAEVEEDARSE
jgi:hypothetical protein